MRNRKDFRSHIVSSMQVNNALKRPLIEICGCGRVLIENHQGVIGYTDNNIQIKVLFGIISVEGNGLRLCRMCKEQLVIVGDIETVLLKRSS